MSKYKYLCFRLFTKTPETMKNSLPSLDDMVFENRNKLYGAFDLRKSYANNLHKATLSGIAIALLISGSSFILAKNNKPTDSLRKVEVTIADYVEPDKPIEEFPVLPPPPIAETPPPVLQKAFIPPVPVDDLAEIIEVIPPKMSELTDARIGKVDVEGVKSEAIIFDAPPPMPVLTGTAKTSGIQEEEMPFTAVEVQPQFIGGTAAMYRWLGKNLAYPGAAVQATIEGKVYLKFIVEKDGAISNVEVMKGIGFGCDEEALRVLNAMPKWNPGKQNGQPVRVYFTIPLVFKLQ